MFQQAIKSILFSFMLLTVLSSIAYADFYVIPVLKQMKNVVTVAKSGGKYTYVQSTLNSITNASESNPYLLFISSGSTDATSAIVSGASNAILGHLSVINEGGGDISCAINNRNTPSVTISNVTAKVSGSIYNYVYTMPLPPRVYSM